MMANSEWLWQDTPSTEQQDNKTNVNNDKIKAKTTPSGSAKC